MRFLIDQNHGISVARGLAADGHDAVHVSDCRLDRATDAEIFQFARAERRVVVTRDNDFLRISRHSGKPAPSIIYFPQRVAPDRPKAQLATLRRELPALDPFLRKGAYVTVGRDRVQSVNSYPMPERQLGTTRGAPTRETTRESGQKTAVREKIGAELRRPPRERGDRGRG